MSAAGEPARVVPWLPVMGWCALASAPTVLTIGRDGRDLTLSAALAALVLGAALSSGLDDAAEVTTASAPTPRWRRRLARLGWTSGALVTAAVVLAIAIARDDGTVSVGGLHLLALAATAAAASLAVTSRADGDGVTSPGLAGSAGALVTVLVLSALSWRVRWAPSPVSAAHTQRWWLVAALAAVAAAPLFRDPASRRVARGEGRRGRPRRSDDARR